MMTEETKHADPNYGTVGEREVPSSGQGSIVFSSGDERAQGTLVHLSVFVNLFTVVLGPVAALAIWMFYRDRSKRVAFQAPQSPWY